MYTYNFYRCDEVCAALQLTISNRRYRESLFWVKELLESKEYEKIFETLFITWFYNIGLGNIEVLDKILNTNVQDENEVYNLVYGMSLLKESMRDCTLPVMFIYGVSNPKYKNRNIHFQLPASLKQDNPKIDAFIRATLLGKFLESWLLYQTTNVSTSIDKLVEVKIKDTNLRYVVSSLQACEVDETYKMCALIGILCSNEEVLLKSFGSIKRIDSDAEILISQYNALVGKRKRRALTIPKDCLYGKTKRGGMTYAQSNLHELYDCDYIIENSKVYDTILEKYGSYEDLVESSNALDEFISWYFPDDIPDEWSRPDQEKSHGNGVNQASDKPLLRRYFMRWVDLKSNCKIWDRETVVYDTIQRIKDDFDHFYIEKKLLSKYSQNKKRVEEESNTWNLQSLKYVLSMIE